MTSSTDYPPLLTANATSEAQSTNENEEKLCLASLKHKKFYLDLVRSSFAEFVGTALYMFVGATSLSNYVGNDKPHLPTVALTFGFSFAGLSAAMQHVR